MVRDLNEEGLIGTYDIAGHFWRAMSRADVKELGELIDEGRAALVVVGEPLR